MYKYYTTKMMIGPLADRPSSFSINATDYRPVLYLETDDNTLAFWNGTSWQPLTLSAVVGEQEGSGSFQPVAADLNLGENAGTSEAGDTDFLAGVMGNVLGEDLEEEHNYLGGVIGAYNILGTKSTVLPAGGVIGVIGDGVTEADAAVVAHFDGGDPSAVTTARAAFGVTQANNAAGSGAEFGVDLKSPLPAELDTLMSGTAEAFAISKALLRGPNDWCLIVGAAVPVDYTDGTPPATGEGYAAKGSIYIGITAGGWWKNTGTLAEPVWTEMVSA